MTNLSGKTKFVFAVGFLFSIFTLPIVSSPVEAKTFKVNCNRGNQTIQKALDQRGIKDGDEIEVSGDCVENIEIRRDHIRLRGANGATITAADPSDPVIVVQGGDVQILDFASISGGSNGIALRRSASARIDNCTVEGNSGNGINVTIGSAARITDSTVQNNGSAGIAVTQAHAQVFANTIVSNASHGVRVQEAAGAEIDDNTISDNGNDGIRVRRTSHIALSGGAGFGGPNILERNAGWGVRCHLNSSAEDPVGQTYGAGANANTSGDFDVATGCSDEGAGFP